MPPAVLLSLRRRNPQFIECITFGMIGTETIQLLSRLLGQVPYKRKPVADQGDMGSARVSASTRFRDQRLESLNLLDQSPASPSIN